MTLSVQSTTSTFVEIIGHAYLEIKIRYFNALSEWLIL